MAKKKVGQQLDLFGAMFAAEEPALNAIVEQAATEKTVVEEKVEATEALNENPTLTNNNIVFANDNIGVKIKAKTATAIENTKSLQSSVEPQLVLAQKPVEIKEPIAKSNKLIKPSSTNKKDTIAPVKKNKRGRKSFKEMDDEVGLVNVPDEEILNKKLYYPIREVAAFFNVNTSLIRAWETEFDILKPRKNRKGDRLFRVEDIKNLQIIYFLLRNRKFSVDGAKKYLKENKKKADTQQQLVQSLTKFRSFLLELKATLPA
jgi:DNA-binding transcriptional MerR regulator